MAKTLLEIAQAVTAELQLPIPSVALTSQDLTVRQLISLIVAACDELDDIFDWQQLLSTSLITTSDGVSLYNLPSDYLRLIPNTQWDRTNRWPLIGNLNPQQFQALESGIVSTAPYTRYRIKGNKIQVLPVPGATPITFAMNYISKNYVVDGTTGDPKASFTADNDKTLFHDRMLINFAKLKLMQVKGFDTSSVVTDFNSSFAAATGADVPSPFVYMSSGPVFDREPRTNIPDGNWGSI